MEASARERLELVLELARRVASLLDLETLLREACRLIAEAFGYDTVGINLRDPLDPERLYQAAAYPPQRRLPEGFRLPISRGLTGWVTRSAEPRLANDVTKEPLYVASPGRQTRSELDVPLVIGSSSIGVLNVESDRVDAFSAEDVPYVQGLANLLAQAIENARLAARSRELAANEERNRIARDLHDDTLQALIAISRQLDLLRADILDQQQAEHRVDTIQQFVLRTVDGVRRLSRNLSPRVLEDLGLVPALEAHAADLEAAGLAVTVLVQGKPIRLPLAVASAAYRVVQEALANTLRHSGAHEARVRVRFSPNTLEIGVDDRGQGFRTDQGIAAGGQGLASMRDRATEIRASLAVKATPGKGTRVTLTIPLKLTLVDRL